MKRTGTLREFARYTSLSVLGMLGLSCYILADTFFVARGLGASGLAALNLAIPVYSFISGAGLMLGMGGGTRYAIMRGQGDGGGANRVFKNALLLAGGFAALFVLLGLFGASGVTRLLGADGAVFEMCRTYLRVLLLFSPMFLLNSLLLCFVRNDGAPHRSMLAMTGGSLSNILLDYVFIFLLDMGIFGAVLATGLAPVISLLILSPHFVKRQNQFRAVRCRFSGSLVRRIVSSGVPSLVTEVSSGVVMIVFNTIILGLAGNVGVAAYGVIANLSIVLISIYNGIAQGIQPIFSSSHGRGDTAKIGTVLRYGMLVMGGISVLVYVGILVGAEGFAAVFNSEGNAQMQSIAVTGLRLYFSAGLFCGFNIVLSVYFTATARPRPAHILSILRGFALILPLTFLLSAVGGLTGVWLAFPVTELLTAVTGLAGYLYVRKRAIGDASPETARRTKARRTSDAYK